MESEQSFRTPPGPTWRTEPFRLFFVLGVTLSWVGVGHWLLYALGVTRTYSCELHGLIQMQGFLMAFAVGFLLTALPRRTQSAPPTSLELAAIACGLVATTLGSLAESWATAQIGYVIVFLVLIRFAVSRFLGATAARRPPAAFVLIPIAIVQGLLGAVLIATESYLDDWVSGFGKLLVQQGVFLCLVIGVGSLILPLMSGLPPPPDLGSSPRETRKAALYAIAGITVFASLLAEQLGWHTAGPMLRAVVVALGLGLGGHTWHRPTRSGLHRQLVWWSTWMIPIGLTASAVWPDFRVAALHVSFISGLGLMAFGVATHVSLTHLGMGEFALARPWPVVAIAVSLPLATITRLAADASHTYFEHLGWAAGFWLIGTALWLAFFVPAYLRTPRPSTS